MSALKRSTSALNVAIADSIGLLANRLSNVSHAVIGYH